MSQDRLLNSSLCLSPLSVASTVRLIVSQCFDLHSMQKFWLSMTHRVTHEGTSLLAANQELQYPSWNEALHSWHASPACKVIIIITSVQVHVQKIMQTLHLDATLWRRALVRKVCTVVLAPYHCNSCLISDFSSVTDTPGTAHGSCDEEKSRKGETFGLLSLLDTGGGPVNGYQERLIYRSRLLLIKRYYTGCRQIHPHAHMQKQRRALKHAFRRVSALAESLSRSLRRTPRPGHWAVAEITQLGSRFRLSYLYPTSLPNPYHPPPLNVRHLFTGR